MLDRQLDAGFPFRCLVDLIARQLQDLAGAFADIVVILNDQYGCLFGRHSYGLTLRKVSVNTVPLSWALWQVTSPPISDTYRRTMLSPKPVPGMLPVLWARKNGSNRFFWSSSGIPMPSSLTTIKQASSLISVLNSMKVFSPEYLMAFDIRLMILFFNRLASSANLPSDPVCWYTMC